MSFGDLLTELIHTQQEKGLQTVINKPENKDKKQVVVKAEDSILTDEEFHEFMKENEYLIYEKEK